MASTAVVLKASFSLFTSPLPWMNFSFFCCRCFRLFFFFRLEKLFRFLPDSAPEAADLLVALSASNNSISAWCGTADCPTGTFSSSLSFVGFFSPFRLHSDRNLLWEVELVLISEEKVWGTRLKSLIIKWNLVWWELNLRAEKFSTKLFLLSSPQCQPKPAVCNGNFL